MLVFHVQTTTEQNVRLSPPPCQCHTWLGPQRHQFSDDVLRLVEITDPNSAEPVEELSLMAAAACSALAAHTPEDVRAGGGAGVCARGCVSKGHVQRVEEGVHASCLSAPNTHHPCRPARPPSPFFLPTQLDSRSGAVAHTLRTLEDQPNSLSVLSAGGGPAGEAPHSNQALLNPLSKAAQQLAPVLLLLRRAFDVDMQIVLNPQASVCV